MSINPISFQGIHNSYKASKEEKTTFAPTTKPIENSHEALEQSLEALANIAKGTLTSINKIKTNNNLQKAVENSRNLDIAIFEQAGGKFEKVNDIEHGKASLNGKPYNGTIHDGSKEMVYKNGKLIEASAYPLFPNFYDANGKLQFTPAIQKAGGMILNNKAGGHLLLFPKDDLLIGRTRDDEFAVYSLTGGRTYICSADKDFVKNYLEDLYNGKHNEAIDEYADLCKTIGE